VIYNNLLFFLTAIFMFSMASIPAETMLPGWLSAAAFVFVLVVFDRFARNGFRKQATHQTSGYFRAEKHLSIAALIVFTIFIFGLDLKYYLAFLSFGNMFPALVNIAGLMVFLLLLAVVWRRGRKNYETVFARHYSTKAFIFSNIKANLPIVIPWVVLSLCYDLVGLLHWPWLQDLANSEWGDFLFFGIFLLFVFIFFPPLVRRLWGCREIDEGPLKDHLTAFCEKQNFTAAIYLWPLFEGRVITAGVMGIIPGLRYILITPALIETMTLEELDSVMAHEIGHVKRFHLLFYVFLIGGFTISSGFIAEPFYQVFFSKDYFYSFVNFTGLAPDAVKNVVITVPLLLFLLIYFRFIFGYFMRNFERQADLHVFPVLGNSRAIISAFEKIAILSGNTRDKPSWHHFGIGQRVDYLVKCEQNPAWIKHQHKKVWLSLGLYVAILVSALFLGSRFSFEEEKTLSDIKYTKVDLLYKAGEVDYPARLLFSYGEAYVKHKMESRAIVAYELAMELEPNQPELLNNYAWLLITCSDLSLRNPKKALNLSRLAVRLEAKGHRLDTLATAWWANGYADEAIETERQAILTDPQEASYYGAQVERFRTRTYLEEIGGNLLNDKMAAKDNNEEEQG
jgi:Zn-dependent protease with chaperone function